MSKLLTVFGATGQQGGSLIDYVLKNNQLSKIFKFRGITRDASSPAALTLKGQGVEIIQADMNDPATLLQAVADSTVVFSVTNFWEKASAAIEVSQGKAVADAAVAAGVEMIIWSSLPNVTKMTSGLLTATKHFDSKAEVETYIRTLPIKSVFFMAGWYMQNHIKFMPPKKNLDGSIVFSHSWNPTSLIPMIDITDTGKFLEPILQNFEKYNGKSFTCATAFYTPLELVDGWTKVTGKKATYTQTSDGEMTGTLTAEMQRELKKSAGLMSDFSYFGPTGKNDLEWTLKQMTEKPTMWEDFVKANEPWF